jgi:hypothetical protein
LLKQVAEHHGITRDELIDQLGPLKRAGRPTHAAVSEGSR